MVIIIMATVLITSFLVLIEPQALKNTDHSSQLIYIDGRAYTTHIPIHISGDSGFTSQNGVTGGSGTKDDPYIISGWYIDAGGGNYGIHISDTSKYFVIKDCYILNATEWDWGSSGIELWRVSNGTIYNNTIKSSAIGIYVAHTNNLTISNNTVEYNKNYGMYLYNYTENIWIENNTIGNNTGNGIYMTYETKNVKIVSNLIFNNTKYGINIGWGASNCEIYNNSLYYNDGSGDVFDSEHLQGYDSGNNNQWDNGTIGNYWHDWANNNNTNDDNGDNIVDNATPIGGNAGSKDTKPLKNSYVPMPPLAPTAPRDLKSTVGNGYINITWSKPLGEGSSPIEEYKVYRNGSFLITVLPGQLWYNDTNVKNGVTYTYYVVAVNSVGSSPKSNQINAEPVGPPSAPQNLNAIEGIGYINLTWEPPANDGGASIIEYKIYRNGTFLGTVSADQLWYNDTNVKGGVTYTYSVSAVNSAGEGEKSNSIQATPGTPVPEFTDLLLITTIFLAGFIIKKIHH